MGSRRIIPVKAQLKKLGHNIYVRVLNSQQRLIRGNYLRRNPASLLCASHHFVHTIT